VITSALTSAAAAAAGLAAAAAGCLGLAADPSLAAAAVLLPVAAPDTTGAEKEVRNRRAKGQLMEVQRRTMDVSTLAAATEIDQAKGNCSRCLNGACRQHAALCSRQS
jgi:uncharacterized tellurite resistance protein B-like protein